MVDWLKESWRIAKAQPLTAGLYISITLTLLLASTSAFLSYRTTLALNREVKERIQLTCNISLANGRSIIETASRDEPIPPEVVELYQSIQLRNINIEIRKFDPDFECTPPSE